MINATHIPVLQKEVIQYLNPKSNENFIDGTVGQGGHAKDILKENGPNGKVLGIELDEKLYQQLRRQKIERLLLVNDSFANLKKIVKQTKFNEISGLLLDLGFSSWHLEESRKGFSFLRDEPLDMRYSIKQQNLTAGQIVNCWPPKNIELILKNYGEERFARPIAVHIVKFRKQKPITTTLQLVEAIRQSVPSWYHHKKIHFATRTFQALRIAVNNELDNLEKVLAQSRKVLVKGGRIVIISFHSLEDRIVKNFFREKKKEGALKILTKKPIGPSPKELKVNPHSRSAKLRAAIKYD